MIPNMIAAAAATTRLLSGMARLPSLDVLEPRLDRTGEAVAAVTAVKVLEGV